MLAIYVHDLDPVALPIYGKVMLRWYGLAYLMGFVAGFLLLRYLAKRDLWVMGPEKVGDFIAACALFGVFLGGRLGYLFFYQLPEKGWETLAKDPLLPFRVWEGGMASHGGILGLAIFTWFYAKKRQVSWAKLADGLCCVGPLGLFFGRMANFINGELYGRVANGVPWAVKFPLSILDESEETRSAAWQACERVDPKLSDATSFEPIFSAARENPKVSEALAEYLQPRHPSQIYEGLLEGLFLFVILWVVRMRFPKAPAGLITGLFFALYAIFRIIGEQFREPDAALVWMLTKGQFFSLFMFLFAAGFFAHAWKNRKVEA
ncbi:MAG: prolipoprotein diacylglyceryl transferase [Akkermansiaceae bacterium]|nr:prolipoprotein diacylglyceryl transferase [Akkermansiaceae bacterium]